MQAKELLSLYQKAGWVDAWVKRLRAAAGQCLHLKGITGSLDTVLAAAVYQHMGAMQLFILHDQEEAAYFYSDLQYLVGGDRVLLYPAVRHWSHAQANPGDFAQLVRAEVCHSLHMLGYKGPLIVTYPEALLEKVVSKADFLKHTWSLQVGQELIMTELATWLSEQQFEKTDFVYEVGQFAIRGGIVDIFSHVSQQPFRLVLWGNTIDSIRTFDPASQCTLDDVPQVTILPNLQANVTPFTYQSLLACLPPATPVWMQDQEIILATIEKNHKQAIQGSQEKKAEQPTADLLPPPISYWETTESFMQALQNMVTIEFGKRFYNIPHAVLTYEASVLPPFHQNMALLVDHLCHNQAQGLTNIIAAESATQFGRLRELLAGYDHAVHFKELPIGLRKGFIDHQVGVACYTDHQIFGRYYRYKSPKRYAKTQAITLRELKTLQTGDYVVHTDYGIGRFAGLHKTSINGKQQEMIRLLYKDDDLVYIGLQALHKVTKYTGKEGVVPTITKLGTTAWAQKKKKIKSKIQDVAKELIQLYSQRKQAKGFAFSPDNFLHAELAASFKYEETPDQSLAIAAVTKDMEAPYPMDRLLCGDVGFGKTEVAIRAAFKAVHDNKQVAVLVPTTILALQHYNAFCSRLARLGIHIAYINRFKTTKEIRDTLAATEAGKVQILIGTHRLLSQHVKFCDLGLLIIDEEQKFGVQAKDRLKQLRVNVDVLTLTATPIPRTLHFSLMGARDLSIITTPPPNRQPITTSIHKFDTRIIQEAIGYELQRGGQVFFVHNRVNGLEEMANMVHKLVPDCRIGIAHGQMSGVQLEKRMLQFMEGAYDVLVTTNIIESGLDIPNVNTIFIQNSQFFGLSDLHQMRGRVGRADRKAFCYLFAPPSSTLTVEARRRLNAIEELADLGDGFKVAMRDLDIRGAGNLLGAEQSGFIADVGFETYCKIIDEAVQELKKGAFKALFMEEDQQNNPIAVLDCALETDLEALIPETYVSNTTERMCLYTRLDQLQNNTSLQAFQEELRDRFGPIPLPVQTLIQLISLRCLAKQCGLTKLKLKDGTMRCYFTCDTHPQQDDVLSRVLQYVQQLPKQCRIQETKAHLVLHIDQVAGIEQASAILKAL